MPRGTDNPRGLTCSTTGCDQGGRIRRGLCVMHYGRLQKAGRLLEATTPMPPFRETEAQRFWAKVEWTADDHLLWRAFANRWGYGYFRSGQVRVAAHRWAYERLIGPVPAGLDLDHLCRITRCVNPLHVEPVTRAENVRRMHGARRELVSQ